MSTGQATVILSIEINLSWLSLYLSLSLFSLYFFLSPSDRSLLCAWIKVHHASFMGSAKSSACFANSIQLLRGGQL